MGTEEAGEFGLGDGFAVCETPKQVRFFNDIPVKAVASGGRHTIFLTRDGLVFSCGDNQVGQLGYDQHLQSHIPRCVEVDTL